MHHALTTAASSHTWITLNSRNVVVAASAALIYAVGRYVWDVWPAAEPQCSAAYEHARQEGCAAWLTCYDGKYSVNQAFRLENNGLRCEGVRVTFDELADTLESAATARSSRAGESHVRAA